MSEEEIKFLKEIVVQKVYKKKEIIQRQGDIQRYLAFILSGAIRFFYTDENGNEQTLDFAFEHMPIGQYKGVLSSNKSPAFVEAIENTVLIGVSKDNFLAFLQRFPRYYSVITEILGEALIDVEVRNKLLRISSSKERYQELCRLKPEVIQRVPLTYIASYLKMALGTLSRVRAGKL